MRYRYMLPSVLVLLVALPSWAEEPPGIVMTIAGDTDPPLSPMTEIPAGVSVRLRPDTKLTFLHYALCKLVTVTGGTLILSPANFRQDGGASSEAEGPCPRVYTLTDTGQGRTTSGIVTRGVPMPPRWPASPEILFTGSRASTVTLAAILDAGQPPMPLVVAGGRARPPNGAAPLSPNGHYTLRLTLRDRSDPVDVPFVATDPSGSGSLVVLRVD
jgi:hypothetical protein